MEKETLYTKRFIDEKNRNCLLRYSILAGTAEWGRFYGLEIEQQDEQGNIEKESVEGLSENKKEIEKFICRLWAATALPVELHALCDDFISEREYLGKYKAA